MAYRSPEKKNLEATVSEASKSSDNCQICVHTSFEDTFNLIAPIVEFDDEGGLTGCPFYPQLSNLLVKGASPSQFSKGPTGNNPPAFRWIHVPVNKMDWAQRVVENVLGEPMMKDQPSWQNELAGWIFHPDRWERQRRGIETFHPLYAQYLQPNLWRYKEKNYALFMPYLHFDSAKSNKLRSATIKWISKDGRDKSKEILVPPSDPNDPDDQPDPKDPKPLDDPEFIGSKIIKRFLDHGGHCEKGGTLHIRRSLDQFYYDTQPDTDSRDEDQIVYKYTKTHQGDLKKQPVLMMVDQLWLWVLQDASVPTVVTSFPSVFQKGKNKDMDFRPSDLFQRIINDLSNECMPDRQIAKSAAHLALTIVKKASGTLVSKTLPYHQQFLWMFDNAIADFAWKQTELWEKFRENFSHQAQQEKIKHHERVESNACKKNEEKLSISEEIDLVRDIRDVLDELNIISSVILDQKPVIAKFGKHVLSPDRKHDGKDDGKEPIVRHPLEYVEKIEEHVEKMQRDATREFEELKNLLDLKQQQTSIALAEETGRQGSTMLLFTFITGFFLPPSFFTSVFGMNVPEIGQLRGAIVAAIIAPASVFLIVMFLVAGLRITYSHKNKGKGAKQTDSRNVTALNGGFKLRRPSMFLNLQKSRSSSWYEV